MLLPGLQPKSPGMRVDLAAAARLAAALSTNDGQWQADIQPAKARWRASLVCLSVSITCFGMTYHMVK